jgi:hypothetical protein
MPVCVCVTSLCIHVHADLYTYNKAPGWANLINSGGLDDVGITRQWQEEADEADSNSKRTD